MNSDKPDWYDALLGDPLRQKTFTNELANKIKSRTISPVERKFRLRKYWIGFAVAIVFGIVLFIRDIPLLEKWNLATIGQSPAGWRITGIPADEQLVGLINVGSREDRRQILHKEVIDRSSMLLFTKTILAEEGKMIWEIGIANWTQGGMIWERARESTIPIELVSAEEYEEAWGNNEVLRFEAGIATLQSNPAFRLIYGSIADSRVSQVRVKDEKHKLYDTTLIHNVHGGYSLWYTSLSGNNGNYTAEAVDKEGRVLGRIEI
jgi:hypothetical protein